MCREVCSGMLRRTQQLFGTTSEPIQIDETVYQAQKIQQRMYATRQSPVKDRHHHVVTATQRMHGNRIDGPWVFRLKKGIELRYF